MVNHIKNLLPSFLNATRSKSWKAHLYNNWAEIVGDLQTHVRLEKILPDNTLLLGVENTSWLQELYLLSPMLIKKINQSLDQPYIKEVRFKYSPPQERKAPKAPTKKRILKKERKLSSIEQRALERIEDKELQSVLKQFLARCHRER